jgi:hypothetical protein
MGQLEYHVDIPTGKPLFPVTVSVTGQSPLTKITSLSNLRGRYLGT